MKAGQSVLFLVLTPPLVEKWTKTGGFNTRKAYALSKFSQIGPKQGGFNTKGGLIQEIELMLTRLCDIYN